jgi:hypothetical protein
MRIKAPGNLLAAARQVLLFAALLALFVAKAPDGLTKPQLWAEDGTLFFAQQHQLGWKALFIPYAGYLQITQRIIACLAGLFPVGLAPLLYYLCAVTACALAVLALTSPRDGFDAKALLVLPVLLVPASGEVFGTLTNVHWTFQFYLLILLFYRSAPCSTAGRRAEYAAAALLSLTGVFSILLSPLFLLRWLLRRRSAAPPADTQIGRRYLDTITAVVLAGALVQAVLVWKTGAGTAPGGTAHNPPEAVGLIGDALQMHFLTAIWLTRKQFLEAVLAFTCAIGVAGYFSRFRFEMLCCAVFLLAGLFGCYAKLWHFLEVLIPFDNGDRYFFAPKVLVWWLAAYAVFGLPLPKTVRWTAVGALLVLLLKYASWTDQFARPPLADLDWKRYVPAIESGQPVTIPINPPGWSIVLGEQ